MFTLSELEDSARLIYQHMPATPQYSWDLINKKLGCNIWVKHENHTPTGAFKVRGGFVLMDKLSKTGVKGVVSATRGNHGQSLALAGRIYNISVTIVVPLNNSPEKNASMVALGAELIEAGNDFDEARKVAVNIAKERQLYAVPPFCTELVKGVATYALEFLRAEKFDYIYVPIGMGSGICGMIKARDLLGLETEIIGVVSSNAPAIALSLEQGKIVSTDTANTFADGMACREPLQEVVDILAKGAQKVIRVSDDDIRDAIKLYYSATHQIAEGAGAASLAAAMVEQDELSNKKVGVVLSGGNIDASTYIDILNG